MSIGFAVETKVADLATVAENTNTDVLIVANIFRVIGGGGGFPVDIEIVIVGEIDTNYPGQVLIINCGYRHEAVSTQVV